MSAFAPRPYQEEALAAIEEERVRGTQRTLLTLPTGCGKTATFLWLIERAKSAGYVSTDRPAVILAHREELLKQPYERLEQMGARPPAGMFAFEEEAPLMTMGIERAESRAPQGCDVIIASVQTVGRPNARLANIRPGLVIIDEAHHATAPGYKTALQKWGGLDGMEKGGPFVLGVTATAKRLDKKGLVQLEGSPFQSVAYSYDIPRAIDEGYLCPIVAYRVMTKVNLDGVKTRAGEFAQDELARMVDNRERTMMAILKWEEVAADRKTIAFCVNVHHAKESAALWRERGVAAEHVDGTMDREARAQVLERYKSGKTKVLTNCEILTEGFDDPATSCIVHLRPTKSWALYVQMTGRGTRIFPGKENLVVLDVADVSKKHSLVSVPAILDLPPGLDLEGRSLSDAKKLLDKVVGAGDVADLVSHIKPKTFSEIVALLEKVDILSAVERPMETAGSSFAWSRFGNGYILDCGEGREAKLSKNAAGRWEFAMKDSSSSRAFDTRTNDLSGIMTKVDALIRREWPNATKLAGANAQWRNRTASAAQVTFLAKLGIDREIGAKMTCDQASRMIGDLLRKKKEREGVRA